MPKYKVLKPIGLGVRVEAGSVVELDEEQAKNIGVGEYLEPLETSVAPEKTTVEPNDEEGAQTTDSNSKEEGSENKEENTQVNSEQDSQHSDESQNQEQTQPEGDGNVPEGHVAHVVTQEDFDNNPELLEEGVKVGETIYIPKPPEA